MNAIKLTNQEKDKGQCRGY